MNIKVAIRVRPFNNREKKLKSDLCVQMKGNSTIVLDESGKPKKTYSFDHSFWSHSGYKEQKNGYYEPQQSIYSDQQDVYNCLGKDLLKNALKGYNCCLFAYGQTGSGKSYSIFGYGVNKGIVPMICEELLNGEHLKKDDKNDFVLSVSMLEIYNERVQDLLIPISKRSHEGLKVRQNPVLGVFVENLNKFDVNSYKDIKHVIEKGNENKTFASTLMNANSSRAHTIITLELLQKRQTLTKTTQKQSVIHLVDLAGSEKVKKTQAKDDRLKEACSINKSLSVLGRVIHQLYKKSKGKNILVSYRDSILTRLLQNALGGNSKTTMICAISPARDNEDETLSTLRYADQAKMIKLKPKINESETDKMIRELMEENEKLKKMLNDLKLTGKGMGQGKLGEGVEEDIQDQIRELENVIMFKTDNKSGSGQEAKVKKLDKLLANTFGSVIQFKKMNSFDKSKIAHIVNLNEDPLLSCKIYYDFGNFDKLMIGREEKEEIKGNEKFIILKGVGIMSEHMELLYDKQRLFLSVKEPGAASTTFVNGQMVSKLVKDGEDLRLELNDLDRVIIGTSTTFLVRLPKEGKIDEKKEVDGKEIDWEYCQMEKFNLTQKIEKAKKDKEMIEKQKELEENKKKLEENFEKEKSLYKKQLEQQAKEYQKTIQLLEQTKKESEVQIMEVELDKAEQLNSEFLDKIEVDHQNKQLQFQIKMNNLKNEAKILKEQKKINSNLETNLIHFYPSIQEANIIAKELHRRIEFVPFLASLNLISALNQKNLLNEKLVMVKLINREDGWINYWTLDKFEDRLSLIKEAIDYFFQNNAIGYDNDNDPFWDPKQFFIFGEGLVMAKNILYRFELEHKVGILGYSGDIGYIIVRLIPINDSGEQLDDQEMEELIEEPDDLITNNLSCHYKIEIKNLFIYDISELKNKNCFLKIFALTSEGIKTFQTQMIKITDNKIMMLYSQFVNIKTVDLEIIDHYMNKNLEIQFLVEDIETVEAQGKLPPPLITKERNLFNPMKYNQEKPKKVSKPQKLGVAKQKKLVKSNVCRIF